MVNLLWQGLIIQPEDCSTIWWQLDHTCFFPVSEIEFPNRPNYPGDPDWRILINNGLLFSFLLNSFQQTLLCHKLLQNPSVQEIHIANAL
jgi:hypothetical protein